MEVTVSAYEIKLSRKEWYALRLEISPNTKEFILANASEHSQYIEIGGLSVKDLEDTHQYLAVQFCKEGECACFQAGFKAAQESVGEWYKPIQ